MKSTYRDLLERTRLLLARAKTLLGMVKSESKLDSMLFLQEELSTWIRLIEQVCDIAKRRVFLGEQVPNCDKLFGLIWDGVRKSVDVCIEIADALGVPGWR